MARRKIETITPQDVAAHLARRTKDTKSREKVVSDLMDQFDADTIKKSLVDRKRGKRKAAIDLGWYVKELLKLYRDK